MVELLLQIMLKLCNHYLYHSIWQIVQTKQAVKRFSRFSRELRYTIFIRGVWYGLFNKTPIVTRGSSKRFVRSVNSSLSKANEKKIYETEVINVLDYK